MNINFDPLKNQLCAKSISDLVDVDGVFYDERAITTEDRDHAEERFVVLGMDGFGRLLVVVYHYRGEDEIRVISARSAEPHERRVYADLNEQQVHQYLDGLAALVEPVETHFLFLDDDILAAFRERAAASGKGYQTLINETLRSSLSPESAPLTAELLRKILHEELRVA